MLLAWFTPLPPSRSGVAAYSAELLPLLAADHEVDVFLDASRSAQAAESLAFTRSRGFETPYRALSAHDFLWMRQQRPYDLVVYQMGNAACHDYMWPYLLRHPGLVILHDGELHHARAHQLLDRQRSDEYRSELHHSHPETTPATAGLVIGGLATTLLYLYPLLRSVARAARMIGVHSDWLANDVQTRFPDMPVRTLRMGVADPLLASAPARDAGVPDPVRQRHHIRTDAIVFAAFGGVTPEKRVSPALKAFSAVAAQNARAHLLLVGHTVPHYDAESEATRLGVRDRVTFAGYVDDGDLPLYLRATDVGLCLRWPSSRESSASWLRCLAAGKPTIITDLVHTALLPTLDPRTWEHAGGTSRDVSPLAVSIDILDEEHSLTLAMSRLLTDRTLRVSLGQAARAHWAAEQTLERMREDYGSVMEEAARAPMADAVDAPAHLRRDGTEHARQLVQTFGVSVDFLSESRR